MQIESDCRCSAKDLRRILSEVPIEIIGGNNLGVRACMGLGKIIYINGYVDKIKITDEGIEISPPQSGEDCLTFFYKDHRFELKYK